MQAPILQSAYRVLSILARGPSSSHEPFVRTSTRAKGTTEEPSASGRCPSASLKRRMAAAWRRRGASLARRDWIVEVQLVQAVCRVHVVHVVCNMYIYIYIFIYLFNVYV